MNYGPGRIWWRGEHARLEKWWRCSPACISKLYLDRHHQSKLKLKFNLCLSNFCQQNFQNIVTWGVELQSRNTIFACISMESLISGVLPYYCEYWSKQRMLDSWKKNFLIFINIFARKRYEEPEWFKLKGRGRLVSDRFNISWCCENHFLWYVWKLISSPYYNIKTVSDKCESG